MSIIQSEEMVCVKDRDPFLTQNLES